MKDERAAKTSKRGVYKLRQEQAVRACEHFRNMWECAHSREEQRLLEMNVSKRQQQHYGRREATEHVYSSSRWDLRREDASY
jgi:hypothetical protein